MEEQDLDRLRELANIGAGHAATAFAHLVGRTIWMDVPRIAELEDVWTEPDVAAAAVDQEPHEWTTGVFFEFDGYLNALVGILFKADASEAVVRKVTGLDEGELPPHCIEFALMEVGNILASHVASAIADTVGQRLLPSIPTLAMDYAEEQLCSLLAGRDGAHPIRIECELGDEEGELGGLLVLIPEDERV